MNTLGEKITELRKKSNITQDELAEILGVTHQTVSLWETDNAVPKADKLKALCEYFNVKPDYFLFDNCKMEPLVAAEEEITAEEVSAAEEISVTATEEPEPRKKSRKRTVIITCAVIIAIIVAAIMLFIAWLYAPEEGAAYSVSIVEWNFDIVTILQILAGVILFAVACVLAYYLFKYIKNRKK